MSQDNFLQTFQTQNIQERKARINELPEKTSFNTHIISSAYLIENDVNNRLLLLEQLKKYPKCNKEIQDLLILASRDSNSQIKMQSIKVSFDKNCPKTSYILIERFDDIDDNVKFLAIDLASKLQDPKTHQKLIEFYNRTDNEQILIKISEALFHIGPTEAIPTLTKRLHTLPSQVIPIAIETLKKFGPVSKNSLIKLLKQNSNPEILSRVIVTLQDMDGESVIKAILPKTRSDEKVVRDAAKNALIRLDDPKKYIVKKFKDDFQNIVLQEIIIKKATALDELFKIYEKESGDLKTVSQKILSNILTNFINEISSTNPKILSKAIYSIMKYHEHGFDIPNFPTIMDQISQKVAINDSHLQVTTLKACRLFNKPIGIDQLTSIGTQTTDKALIIECLRNLGRIAEPSSVEFIKNYLKNPDDDIKKDALLALGQIGSHKPELVVSHIRDCLYTPILEIKKIAMDIADKLRNPSTIEALKNIEEHGPNTQIRKNAKDILTRFQNYFADIIKTSSSPDIIISAINGLKMIGKSDQDAIDSLLRLAETSPDVKIRNDSIEALGELGNEKILDRLENIDKTEPTIRTSINKATSRIQECVSAQTLLDRLKCGEIPDDDIKIIQTLVEDNHSFMGEHAKDAKTQLTKTAEHLKNENWGEAINRINNFCEDIVKEIFDKKKNTISVPDNALLKKDHMNKIEILENRCSLFRKDDPFILSLKQIHVDRRTSDAQHGGGVITTKSNARQAVQALIRIYFKSKEVLG